MSSGAKGNARACLRIVRYAAPPRLVKIPYIKDLTGLFFMTYRTIFNFVTYLSYKTIAFVLYRCILRPRKAKELKDMKIYVKIGNREPVVIDKARNKESAEAKIARFEREDRYEIEVEKYKMPEAWSGKYPVYSYR